ncbi:hypothetical protein JG687_00012780 [Phytophthora cactorum]|uniref:Uncharacterized protein n=1 Tax=Phytophthora cactorum TaxID=29920 RepID=A0A8T1U166_9STRA|nr:hypothetical protein JG687_00012780 [Phytophthora cactorum]
MLPAITDVLRTTSPQRQRYEYDNQENAATTYALPVPQHPIQALAYSATSSERHGLQHVQWIFAPKSASIFEAICYQWGGDPARTCKRCIVPGCRKQAYERTCNYCNSHFQQYQQTALELAKHQPPLK